MKRNRAPAADGKACTLKRYTPPSGLWKFALAFSSSGPERGLAYTDATDWWYSESTTISCTVASRASRNTAYSPPRTAAKEYLRTVSPVMTVFDHNADRNSLTFSSRFEGRIAG